MLAFATIASLTICMQFGMHSAFASGLLFAALAATARGSLDEQTYNRVVASKPAVGDIVFTRIGGPIFSRVAATTQSWTSHVGIIVDYRNGDWIVAESGIPTVRKTPLRRFLGRSEGQEFSIRRLKTEPTDTEKLAMRRFADSQMGKFYSLGFDLQSRKTFCSKFVHDAVFESTHQSIGEIESFGHLLHRNPDAPLLFWRTWFLGFIPWQRTTITPASELESPLLRIVIQNQV
jgi:Permuted papain-like amidase enzyme, YaeF/YiiX, C92 family